MDDRGVDADGYFDRILAVHVLEHLPNLPAAIRECYRLCNKTKGYDPGPIRDFSM